MSWASGLHFRDEKKAQAVWRLTYMTIQPYIIIHSWRISLRFSSNGIWLFSQDKHPTKGSLWLLMTSLSLVLSHSEPYIIIHSWCISLRSSSNGIWFSYPRPTSHKRILFDCWYLHCHCFNLILCLWFSLLFGSLWPSLLFIASLSLFHPIHLLLLCRDFSWIWISITFNCQNYWLLFAMMSQKLRRAVCLGSQK